MTFFDQLRELDRKAENLDTIRRELKADPRLSAYDRKLLDLVEVQAAALQLNREKMLRAAAANDLPATARCLEEIAGGSR